MLDRRQFLGAASALGLMTILPRVHAQAPDRVSMRMNWTWQGHMAPFVLGKSLGYYEEAGIDAAFDEGRGSATTVRLVGSGNETFGLSDTSTGIFAATEGVPVKQIFTLNVSDMSMIWVEGKTNIETGKDLAGKSIATTGGDAGHQLLEAVLAASELKLSDIKLILLDPSAKVSALRENRVDILIGGAADQPVILRSQGVPALSKTFGELGLQTLGLGILVNGDAPGKHGDIIKRFVSATRKSWMKAAEDPEAAVAAMLNVARLDREILLGSLKVIIGLLTDRDRIGYTPDDLMQSTFDALRKYRGLKATLTPGDYYSNAFISA